MLHVEQSRNEIAQVLWLRPAFIKDYLAQYPELKAQWGIAHAAKETEKHRAQLLAALRHGRRYARFRGLAEVQVKCLLSAPCQNMKKIALLLASRGAALLTPNSGCAAPR